LRLVDLDETESARRRRCRPDEPCSTVFDVTALSDCQPSDTGAACDCPGGYVLQHGVCIGQYSLLYLVLISERGGKLRFYDRHLQISDRGDHGAQNFNFVFNFSHTWRDSESRIVEPMSSPAPRPSCRVIPQARLLPPMLFHAPMTSHRIIPRSLDLVLGTMFEPTELVYFKR